MVNAARCRAAERAQIAKISQAKLPIEESCVFEAQPNYTPRGDIFILTGGDLAVEVAEAFNQICRVNSNRYKNLEFHLPLDAISYEPKDPTLNKMLLAIDPEGSFSQTLAAINVRNSMASVVYHDGEPLYTFRSEGKDPRPVIHLQWHSTTDGLLACLGKVFQVN